MSQTPQQPYLKVLEDLRAQIDRGSLSAGDKYPSISELVTRYGVAPTTARRALTKLRDVGLAESRHGIGWFVTVPPPPAPSVEDRLTALEAEVRRLRERISA
jgi:GntR family transcriptional regulator